MYEKRKGCIGSFSYGTGFLQSARAGYAWVVQLYTVLSLVPLSLKPCVLPPSQLIPLNSEYYKLAWTHIVQCAIALGKLPHCSMASSCPSWTSGPIPHVCALSRWMSYRFLTNSRPILCVMRRGFVYVMLRRKRVLSSARYDGATSKPADRVYDSSSMQKENYEVGR